MARRHRILTVVAFASVLAGSATADVIHVPGDFATIQDAIDAAVDGDEIIVADGTYTGPGNHDLDFGGGAIVLRSANGPEACILDMGADFATQAEEIYWQDLAKGDAEFVKKIRPLLSGK